MTAPATTTSNAAPTPSVRARLKLLLAKARGDATDGKDAPIYPVSTFAAWAYEDAAGAVEDAVDDSELDALRALRDGGVAPIPDQAVYIDPRGSVSQLLTNRAFFDGDHWQGGAGWIGPHPQTTDNDYSTAMNELVAAFTSKNIVREVVKRHASGVVGKAPTWSFVPRRALAKDETPTNEEEAAIDRANRIVREWYDAKKVRSLIHDATCTLLYGARAPLRVYIPAGLLDTVATAGSGATRTGRRVVRVASIEQALGMIYPDHPEPSHAAVVRDDDTMMEAGVRLYTVDDDESDDDGGTVAAAKGTTNERDEAELVFLDTAGRTVLRIFDEDDTKPEEGDTYTFDFGGRLTMIEMRRDPLVTPQVAQNQRAANLALSMLPRNIVTGGFMERMLLNAQMPGHYEKDPDGVKTSRFIPDPVIFGPNTTNFFNGVVTKDATGKEQITQPSVSYRDPVPVDAPLSAYREHYLAILDEVSQLHVVLSGDAVVSGKSREQARAEFLNSLSDTRPEIEAALRFLLETPLAMAEALAGTPGALTDLVRVEVSCRLDTGPLDPTERAANETSIGKTLSQATAMARNGVDDVEAEEARMTSDPLSRATLLKAQGDALTSATTAGMSVDTAADLLGLDAATLAKIKKDLAEGGFQGALPNAGTGDAPGGAASGDGGTAPPKGKPSAPGKVVDQKRNTTQATGGAASSAGGTT